MNYILYDAETGEIKRASQSQYVSNPHGWEVMETPELMIGVDSTHRVDLLTGELVPLSNAECRKRMGI